MKLLIKLLRDIKQSAGQFLAFVLVIAVGAFFYTGLVTLSDNLSAYTKAYFKEHNLSDLHVYYSQISKQEVADLSAAEGITEGVHRIEGRYTFDAAHSFDNDKATLKVHSIPEQNEINTTAILEGRLPSNKEEMLLDSRYANEHELTIGDQIRIGANQKELTFTISGLGENVEHAKKNDTQDHLTYGIAYIAEGAIPDIAGDFTYNEIIVDAKEGYDIGRLGEAIEKNSERLAYLSQISKERTFSYSQLTATIQNNKGMSFVIPLLLFFIEAIILFLTLSRMIDSQRNQIGIMKALGVNNRSIMLHYMGYPVLVGIIGSIVGFAIAAFVFIPLIVESNANAYSLPGIHFSLSAYSILPPIIISSVFGMLSCYLSGRAILKERAAQALRPKPPKAMKKIRVETVPGVWNRLPYSYKIIMRNIFLNKQKAFASSVGVVVSTVLLITAFGTQTALQKVANQTKEVYTYDLRVDYKMGTGQIPSQLPAGVQNSYSLSSYPIEFIKGDESEKATLIVTERENNLLHFFDTRKDKIPLENNGALVPKSYADSFHISEGDMIDVRFSAPELNQKTVQMKVLKITTQYSKPSFYITTDYLKSFGLDYNPTSLLMKGDDSMELASLRSSFERNASVESISDKSDLEESAQYILKQNSFIFIMFMISAVILSFGAIYTISSINIYERNRELATLKVLGFPKSKINRLIFLENILLTVVAVIVAFPIGSFMYGNVVEALSSTHQQIPDQLTASSILLSIAMALLLTLLSNLPLRRKVSRIHMIESLKSIE
ncbi:ABC transporter permease [Paenibacillus sp. GCM10027627]|uniref:ABC transporter permease n=1 Tax=unclassified Paenibacillus TaxID=185978 RepID=UPI003628C56F